MSQPSDKSTASSSTKGGFSEAIARLNTALDSLDSTIEASIDSSNKARNADGEVQHMADDRTKLAKELDAAEARAGRLADTNSEVSRRLVGAMEIVRGVLDKSKP